MIHILQPFSLAVLADSRMVIRRNESWTESDLAGKQPVRICTSSKSNKGWFAAEDEVAILMHDGRVLAGYNRIKPGLADISSTVKDLFGADTSNICGICIKGQSLVIWTDTAIGVIHLGLDSKVLSTYHCTLPSEIDIISIDHLYCIVKTQDGRLFGIMHHMWTGPDASSRGIPMDLDRSELAFHDVASISEIHTGNSWALLLMENGSVYGCKYNISRGTRTPFARVLFPEGETVIKIIDAGIRVVYITTAGNCYGQCVGMRSGWTKELVLVRGLEGYVENIVAVYNGSVLVQCNTLPASKTYIIRFSTLLGQPVNIIPLPFFDGISIISVTQTQSGFTTCFVTDDGCVYWSYDIYSAKPTIRRDTFFDENLLPIQNKAASIRSTRSILGEP